MKEETGSQETHDKGIDGQVVAVEPAGLSPVGGDIHPQTILSLATGNKAASFDGRRNSMEGRR
jgi:hypothetical protein